MKDKSKIYEWKVIASDGHCRYLIQTRPNHARLLNTFSTCYSGEHCYTFWKDLRFIPADLPIEALSRYFED